MTFNFEIVGTHEGDKHALPKIKLTKRQHWLPKAQQFVAWKRHVQLAFIDAAKEQGLGHSADKRLVQVCLFPPEVSGKMPIEILPGAHVRMDIIIHFKDGKHADPENIFGSIADALFKNDIRLRGSFDFKEKQPKAKVEVSITFSAEKEMTKKVV